MSKTTKFTFPNVVSGKTWGYLAPMRATFQLTPYGGTYHPSLMNVEKFEDARNWFPFKQENDILISSYVKCGHHFTQKILLEITRANHNGEYTPELYKSADLGLNTTPYIEYYISQTDQKEIEERIQSTDNMYPRVWFTHHSFDDIPINRDMIYGNKQNKMIVTIRNPKDCIVSSWAYFNYVMNTIGIDDNDQPDFTLDDMISYFIRGIMNYGCYFKWYESYWNAMNKDNYNILWLYYEDLVDNPLTNVKKIAQFVFDGNDERNEPQKVLNISDEGYKKILERINIEAVRKDVDSNPQTFELGSANQFFRKGVNDDYKNYFNEQQSTLIDETMYFKWAENASGIRYYQNLMKLRI